MIIMTVKELIKALEKFDENLEVFSVYDGGSVPYDILGVGASPYRKFDEEPKAVVIYHGCL